MIAAETTPNAKFVRVIAAVALIILSWGLAVPSAHAQSKPVLRYLSNFGEQGWVPYVMPGRSTDQPGILIELTDLILAGAGIEGKEVPMPRRRGAKAYRNGEVDFEWASPSWFTGGKFPETDMASIPVLSVRELLMFPAGDDARWLLPQLIQGRTVGTIEGYSYHDSHAFDRFDLRDEKTLVQRVGEKRLEVAIIGELPGRYWARKLDADVGFGPAHSEGALVIRLRGEHKEYLNRINDAISELQMRGEVNQIVAKYIGALELT